MKIKIALPLFLVFLIGCDTTTEEASSPRQEVEEVLKSNEAPKSNEVSKQPSVLKSELDPEVIPETSYPSIFEVEVQKSEDNSSTAKNNNKKASTVLNIGKEKIKVYDESMGSVNEASVKKLREQVK